MFSAFFTLPWSGYFFAGNTLDLYALLLVTGLASAVSFRAGLFNLGVENQVYAGGLAAGAFLLVFAPCARDFSPFLRFVLILCAALAAMAGGAFLAALSGVLKRFCRANEIISSFLLAAALNPVFDYIIANPLRDKNGSLLAAKPLPESFNLPKLLPPSALSVSFIIALLLPVLSFIIINRTAAGYRFRIAGVSPDFARFAGIEAEDYWIPAMGASGALAALAGFFAVTGTYGVVHLGFSGGLGWGGIAVSLIARNRPLALFPAALFYAQLKEGAENALLLEGVSFDVTRLIQALVLLFATVRLKFMKASKY